MADVKVPVLGNVPKGGLFAGGLAAVGVAGYLWYKHQKKQAIAATPATPATGYGYGYGMPAASAYGYAMSAYGYGYGAYGYGFGQYGAAGFASPVSPYGYGIAAPQNNAQWAQNATTALTNQGYTGTAVLAALGAYLSGKPVVQGSSEDTTIQAAIALEGDPPQPGTGGYPPAVNYQGKSGQGSGQVTVPDVVGVDANNAASQLEKAGLTFNPNLMSRGRPGYFRMVTKQNPTAGTKVNKGTYVSITWQYKKEG